MSSSVALHLSNGAPVVSVSVSPPLPTSSLMSGPVSSVPVFEALTLPVLVLSLVALSLALPGSVVLALALTLPSVGVVVVGGCQWR
jgi:hypothetical protein